jgi:HTH-type transcriptional regulator/antitoxin HigA
LTKPKGDDGHDAYMQLVQEFPLRRIRSDRELARASEMADGLSVRDVLAPAEEDYLDVLDGLILQYEKEHHAIPPLTDAELLRELIRSRRVTQREVASATGIVYSTISSVLAGRRNLTRDQIGMLARYFHIDVGSFSFADAENRSKR